MNPRGKKDASEAPAGKRSRRRKLIRRWLGWGIPAIVLLYILVLGVSALLAKNALEEAIPLASKVEEGLASGDTATTEAAVDEIAAKTATAKAATDHIFWRGAEYLPFVGDDLRAVRLAAAAGDDLVDGALKPFASVSIADLGPKDGAINLDVVRSLAEPISEAAAATERVAINLDEIDESTLLSPVSDVISQVTSAVDTAWPILNKLDELAPELPRMLGADGAVSYIVMVQNNAEARTQGGNPASLMMLTADQGKISITQQAASTDFNNGRDASISTLNVGTEALYTDRVGKYIQDTTMTPDFTQTAALVRAFWQETYGDPGNGVLSLDPVALSYILEATGPVTLSAGDEINSDNAVDLLLNQVYFKYPGDTWAERRQQDVFFASAAEGIFGKITSGSAGVIDLAEAIAKAGSENRIYYASSIEAEANVVAGTTLTNPLPTDNEDETAVGVFVNDTTEGKLDYYANMSVDASSDACEVADDETATFTVSATYNYTLSADDVATLPYYISTGRYYPVGQKATELVFYGPVGSTYVSAKVDGEEYVPEAGANDLSRAAVRIDIINDPSTSHTVEVTFSAPSTQDTGQEYGPLSVVHTPLVDDVPVTTKTPGCE